MANAGEDCMERGIWEKSSNKLSRKQVEDRIYLCYTPPPLPASDGTFLQGEVEEWLSRMNELQEDFIWLLELPYNRFWSHFAFEDRLTGILTSYLQNTPRPYELEEFHDSLKHGNSDKIMEFQDKIHALVLSIYVRLSNHAEFEEGADLLTSLEFGDLIYERYIFDIPMMYDLCLIYGESNRSEVAKIICSVFKHQPAYLEDLDDAVIVAMQALKAMKQQTRDIISTIDGIECSKEQPWIENTITLSPLMDLISYLLDIIYSVNSFLDLFPPASNVFLQRRFESLIADIYSNTVPLLYSHIDDLCYLLLNNNPDAKESTVMKKKLHILREQMIKAFNHIVTSLVNEAVKCRSENDEAAVNRHTNNFLDVWYECLPFDVFMKDYNQLYPLHQDLLVLGEVEASEVEQEKISYLMEASLSISVNRKESKCLTTSLEKDKEADATASACNVTMQKEATNPQITTEELQYRITSVSDILPDTKVEDIQEYLRSNEFSVEKAVDAILKDSIDGLPGKNKKQSVDEASNIPKYSVRSNIFDGDEFDIMVHDKIDMSRVNLGKKKDKYKDVQQLIDDKSHRTEMAEMFQHLGLVKDVTASDAVDIYDDEYDDTYDLNEAIVRRSFVTPRVLRGVTLGPDSPEGSESEDGEEQDDSDGEGNKVTDQFVSDPAEMREKMEQKRLAGRAPNYTTQGKGDVVGKPKGQGQDHNTQVNRQKKTANKTGRANHNRKSRSLKKQQQGML